MALIELHNVTKEYVSGRRTLTALRGVSLTIERGEWVTILGPSGCGKSTLLNLLSGIDQPSSGAVIVEGTHLEALSQERLARWRGKAVGIVFQFFQLMPTLTAVENVMLPMELNGLRSRRRRANELLERVGLSEQAGNLPNELSGGEQQRVAVARALANEPPILLADEPTGNLDTSAGQRVIELLDETWKSGMTIVLVTHDRSIARVASRVIEMRDGLVVSDERSTPSYPLEPVYLSANGDESDG
ncbi:MAG TPA: ABC transporter ATP-binding protein [Thermomicrobiaceae bacterium]|nr:ABC transporter ATP-binding protein [Thermomicrobiaceae bacterium]